MGLDITIKGLERKDTYHGGYIRFNIYRQKLAEAYNEELGEIYFKRFTIYKYSDEDKDKWNSLCNNDLDVFLWHSDCDGKLTPKECKKIYNVLKDLKPYNIFYSNEYNMHELFLKMFKFCYQHRVNMWFD